ncbi:PAS domain S-box protein [Algoriphagus sp.]|uniref:PAS domain S-box protein n=1 Tax=Algoriphagus sp. TaxID=1872435 RepID=UPI00391ABE29
MTIQKKNLVLAFIAAVSLLIIHSIFYYSRINVFIESAALVNHTTHVTLELEKIKGIFRDAETAQKGYLLTHDESFLKDFTDGLNEYPSQIKLVKELISDNSEQQKSLAIVEQLARDRDDYLKNLINVEKTRTVTTDELLVSQAIKDSLRSQVNEMITLENSLLEQRSKDLVQQSIYAPLLLLFSSLISLAILIFSYFKWNESLVKAHDFKTKGMLQAFELKLSKEKLKIENRFREMVEQAPVAICLLRGKDLVVEIANKKQLQSWDRTKEEMLNRPIFKDVQEEKIKDLVEMLRGVLETGKPFTATEMASLQFRDGIERTVYMNFICEPLFENQEIVGIMAVSTDVTEQVLARKEVEESEQRFQAAVKAVKGILWTNNSFGELEGEQIGWSVLTGQTYEEYRGFGWANAVHPEDVVQTMKGWNLAMENRSIFDFEHRLKTIDGSFRHFSIRAIPLFNEDGTVRQWVGVHTDISEQKDAEQKIRESESYFRRLTDTVPAIIWITEPNGTCSYLNKLWYDYTGQTKEESLGFGWVDAIHPDDKEQAEESFISASSAQLPFSKLSRFRNSKGEYRWAVDSGSPKFDANDVFEGMIGTVIDIHEEKLAEEKLAYRTALLEAHNQASVDGILLVDAKGKIISYNQRFIEIWNMPQHIVDAKDDEAALSFGMSQLLYPQQFIDKVKYLYEHPNEKTIDYLEFKDGKIVERNGYPVIGEDGSYYAWSWTFKDVTRQKQIEKEIRESEERFRSLAQTLPQLVWVSDGQGKAEFSSIRWKEYSGLEPNGELEWKEIVHSEDYESINAGWIHSLETGNIFKSEVRLKNKDNEYRWHTVIGEPVFDQENNIVKWVGAFTDTNEQKLNDERKDEFVSIASHEMKTPLTTAKAYLQMLELTLDDSNEEATLFTQKANESIDRLTELVSELLDVSKIRLGKLQYNLAFFNFNELINDTVKTIQLTSPTHKIIKTGKVNDQVNGDKYRLQQVVINLLTNAIKYSPTAEEVFIGIEQEDDTIQVSVKDTGIGIAQSSLNRIFDKYHRIDEHAVHFQGLGIGLFISHEIIQRHKGNLWAKSEAGKGSTFYFTIPINS